MDRETVFLPGCEKLYHFGEGGLVTIYYKILLRYWISGIIIVQTSERYK